MNVYLFNGHLDGSILVSSYNNDPSSLNKIKELPNLLNLSEQATNILNVLINDVGTPANQDPTNRLSVDHLLYEIHYLMTERCLTLEHQIIEEQILDLQTGMCPLGRTSRLLQIIRSMDLPQ